MSVPLARPEDSQSSGSWKTLFILLGEMISGFCCFASFSGGLHAVPPANLHAMQLCALGMVVVLMGFKAYNLLEYSWVWPAAFCAGMFTACDDYHLRSFIVAFVSVVIVHGVGFLLWRAFLKKA